MDKGVCNLVFLNLKKSVKGVQKFIPYFVKKKDKNKYTHNGNKVKTGFPQKNG